VSTVSQWLAEAEAFRRAGRLRDAEERCRRVLQVDAADAPAHHLLGLVLGAQGRLDEAAECFRRAVERRPEHVQTWNNLGVALQRMGKLDEAAAALESAVERMPDYAEAHHNLGVTRERQGRLDEAGECCRRAIAIKPDYAPAHNSLGVALERQGKLDLAAAAFRRALQLSPDAAETHSNLAAVLDAQGKLDLAAAALTRALELDAERVEPYVNLSLVLEKQGRLDEALGVLARAAALDPNCAAVHVNLGLVWERQGKLGEAVAAYRRALAADSRCAEAHLNLALALLRDGDFAAGWREFEWRFQCEGANESPRARPRWAGETIEGRAILLCEEQGFGDSLQFVRFVQLVKQRGARVIVECRPQLASLLKSCPGVDAVVAAGAGPVEFDVYLPMTSVPGVWGTSLESIPAKVPYLFPAAALVEKWKQELGAVEAFKVGIAWQGDPANKTDRFRSIPLERFAPVAGIAGVRLYSVQMGAGREQLARLTTTAPISDLGDRLGDFHNTAAILCNLDLIITCDSAPAHLAGALGLPVWVALAHLADWRWMLERTDSPWYPTMRLYRQSRRGDWHEVFERIATDLAERAKQGG
jgi:tetratricopeptide (TPR) repeat protein